MPTNHGTGVSYFNYVMSIVEVRQRVREQQQAAKVCKLKYRGVAYIKATKN